MDKVSVKQSYFLGISLGVCISLLVGVILYKNGVVGFVNNSSNGKVLAKMSAENLSLKSELLEKDKKIDELSKINKVSETNSKSRDKSKVIIEITSDMDNNKIADLLVENGVYKYKNDLLMLLEMIKFNRTKALDVLEANGVISSSYNLGVGLTELERNKYAAAEYLYSNKMVGDRASFMKVIYLLGADNNIKYGKKEFSKNLSLRETGDVLIGN